MSRKDIYRWFRPVRAPMSFESYDRLPRHPGYKLEYWDGQLRISPRWRSHGMFLELRHPETCDRLDEPQIASIRPLASGDWDALSCGCPQDMSVLRKPYGKADLLHAVRHGISRQLANRHMHLRRQQQRATGQLLA